MDENSTRVRILNSDRLDSDSVWWRFVAMLPAIMWCLVLREVLSTPDVVTSAGMVFSITVLFVVSAAVVTDGITGLILFSILAYAKHRHGAQAAEEIREIWRNRSL